MVALSTGVERLVAPLKHPVQNAASDARIGNLGIAELASVVNFFAGQTEVGGGRLIVPVRNNTRLPYLGDFSALLSCIVFVGQPALRLSRDGIAIFLAPAS